MDAWLIQNASMDTTTAAGNGSANAGLVLVEQGSFSAKWNEKKQTYEVFNGGTIKRHVSKQGRKSSPTYR